MARFASMSAACEMYRKYGLNLENVMYVSNMSSLRICTSLRWIHAAIQRVQLQLVNSVDCVRQQSERLGLIT